MSRIVDDTSGDAGQLPRPHTAIVAEGGGQRGIYTAGVLDAFLALRFNPFSLGCGVSAGAQNLIAFFLKQKGYARRAIVDLTSTSDFIVPYRWLAAKSIMDLDGYFERAMRDPDYQLPFQLLSDVKSQRRLVFVATDRETLDAVYLEPDVHSVIDMLKASSAVPFLYRSGVQIGENLLVDGGVADPLPVSYCYEQGARRIVLIRTVAANTDASIVGSEWRSRLKQVRRLPTVPDMLAMLERHETALAEAEQYIADPPDDLELVSIAPRKPLASKVFGSHSEELLRDYHAGQIDGAAVLDQLRPWTEPIEGGRSL